MTQTVPTQLPTEWRDFFALTKPRVMSLVIFTGLCGLLAAPGHINPVLGFTAILCIALGAGGAAALNQWWEADIDAGMKRTAARPLPAGRMTRTDARDAATAVRLALESDAEAGIYNITATDAVVDIPTQDLISRYFPGVAVRCCLAGQTSPMTCARARSAFGFEPRYLWSPRRLHSEGD